MKPMSRFVVLIAAAVVMGACNTTPPAPAKNNPDDIAKVNALREKVSQTYGAGDAAGVGQLYTTDAIAMQSHQPTETGRETIVKDLTGLFSAYAVKLDLMADETVTMGDFGYDIGRYKFSMTPKAAGTMAPPPDEGRYLVLLKKDTDGQWRVARDIGSSSLPMPMPMPMPEPAAAPAKKGGS